MKAGIYLGQEQVEIRELPIPPLGAHDVVIKNICSGICGTDTAVFMHGPNTGHRVNVGGEFGHETVSRGRSGDGFQGRRARLPLSALCFRRHKARRNHRRLFGVHTDSQCEKKPFALCGG